MNYFPAYLNLQGRTCVVIGAGEVATHKVAALRRSGARVTVISAESSPQMQRLARQGRIRLIARRYARGDLKGAFLAIAATDDARVNRLVWGDSQRHKVLVNVVDDTPHCTFVAPSIVRQVPLQLAISTGGASPAIAKRLRRQLQSQFGPEHGMALRWMGSVRPRVIRRVPDLDDRKRVFSELAATDIPGAIRSKGRVAARRKFDTQLRVLLKRFGNN